MSAASPDVEVAVVGGGIAGLSAAWELRDRDVLVLEADARVGGRLMSEPRGRYWLNFGGHVLAGEDSATGRLLAAAGVEAGDVPGVLTALAMNGRVLAGGRVETYPLRLRLTMAERLALIRAGARVRLAVLEYGRIVRRRAGESQADRRARVLAYRDDRTFADFLGPVPAEVDAIFRPTIQRSSGEPEQVSAGYGIGYFHLVWDREGGLSRNVLGGSARLPQAIAAALGDRVRTGAPVDRVVVGRDGVTVHRGDERIRARYAVVATPAFAARELLEGVPAETVEALGRVAYGPYVVGAFLTDEPGPMPYDGVYAVATPKTSFNMLFNTANVTRGPGPREPGGTLMAYSAASLADALADRDDEEVARIYADDVARIFPAVAGHIAEVRIRRWAHGLPHPRPGRHLLQPALERPLGNVFLAGDYLGTTYVDTAVATGTAAAHAIRRRLRE
ncbi:MAG TPA: NAD(P)/FAD-dependent oxidoreductase [Gaiellales bacterium]|jgi:oxygen-dependent protoporphyrinogen oxidase|nr:NAD(P)/FAD-dependent oxidoreductase [Gaiellales bacterium]